MSEVWRPVPGYDGWYDVSNIGRVRSWRRWGGPKNTRADEPLVMSPKLTSYGQYHMVGLRTADHRDMRQIHTLVLAAFVGPRPPGHEGAHLDGNPQHNWLTNLAWVTPKENASHRVAHGTQIHGEQCAASRLTERDVVSIRQRAAAGETHQTLARDYGVGDWHIARVVRRQAWKHVA